MYFILHYMFFYFSLHIITGTTSWYHVPMSLRVCFEKKWQKFSSKKKFQSNREIFPFTKYFGTNYAPERSRNPILKILEVWILFPVSKCWSIQNYLILISAFIKSYLCFCNHIFSPYLLPILKEMGCFYYYFDILS